VLAAVQLDPGAIAADPALPSRVVAAGRRAGVMTRMLATGAIHVSPPLVISAGELDELAGGLRQALDEARSTS
jgi:adenosylmethionine-8-amino-7-oxononanoate aminotransferase